MMQPQGEQTFPVTVNGRVIKLKRPSEGHVVIISRMKRKMQGGNSQATIEAVGVVLDILDAMMTNDDDRQFMLDGIVRGSLDMSTELASIFEQLTAAATEAEETPAPKKAPSRVRRPR